MLAAAYGPPRPRGSRSSSLRSTSRRSRRHPPRQASSPTRHRVPLAATRASSYEQAPTARALPDALDGGAVQRHGCAPGHGRPITPGLAVGFTPHDGQLPDGLPGRRGHALAGRLRRGGAGRHGIRIPLAAAEFTAGFDRIYVFGVADAPKRTSTRPGAQRTARLRTTTPTGSPSSRRARRPTTPQARPPAFSQQDPDHAISFAVEDPRRSPSAADGRRRPGGRVARRARPDLQPRPYADGHGGVTART